MSSFIVNDASGEVVEFSLGENTIGRGPLLKVTDKRVSRDHATIVYQDARYMICPNDKNPCFYKPFGKTSYSVLEKDAYQPMENGDCFSLLPNDLIFRVVDPRALTSGKLKAKKKDPPADSSSYGEDTEDSD